VEKSEIRKDYFLDKYVLIAPKRAKRPRSFKEAGANTKGPCQFCPEKLSDGETVTYEHKNSEGNWDILGIVNKYSALSLTNNRAYGQQEIIIETREHNHELHEFGEEHIANVVNAYCDRYVALKNTDKIRHVIVFKNEGGKAGASVAHSHSQIIALPLLPPKVAEETEAYSKYRLENASCPYCDILKKESESHRVIWEDENILALSPYASDSPYGVWFIPKRHVRELPDLTYAEKISFAKALKPILAKLDELGIAYNYFFENAVNGEDYHMHLKLAPRPNVWAGLELGTGVIINPIPPEFATKVYRGEIEIETDEQNLIKM
jgi:UDPglucose--hexose-1-phosphate uridylyltransferase